MSDQGSVRDQLLDVLLAKVEEDTYPSATMMDTVQQLLPPERQEEYASILLAKVDGDRFPSIDLVRRVMRYA